MRQWLKYVLFGLLLLLIGSIPLAMQFQMGFIRGTVTDEMGPVPYASIEVRRLGAGAIFHTDSNMTGNFRLDGLRVGRYSLFAHAVAHDSVSIDEVIVEGGPGTRVDVHLNFAGVIPTSVGRLSGLKKAFGKVFGREWYEDNY
jgi:hypothetical protein